MKVHLECMYGFYHGQDPRTFDPDPECCTPHEIENHKAAVELANRGEWKGGGYRYRICVSAVGQKPKYARNRGVPDGKR